jgi:hypothetical protein
MFTTATISQEFFFTIVNTLHTLLLFFAWLLTTMGMNQVKIHIFNVKIRLMEATWTPFGLSETQDYAKKTNWQGVSHCAAFRSLRPVGLLEVVTQLSSFVRDSLASVQMEFHRFLPLIGLITHACCCYSYTSNVVLRPKQVTRAGFVTRTN